MLKNPIWSKCGRILAPDSSIEWMATSAGPCYARLVPGDHSKAYIYVSGRDTKGRSHIGVVIYDLDNGKVAEIQIEPAMSLGEKGAFDENGTSYPYLVEDNEQILMYYTGWIQGVQVPWYNELGLAASKNGRYFARVSRAPISMRSNNDYIGIGSSCVIKEGNHWLMWYTRFERWGHQGEHKHFYNIKHARSNDGLHWNSNNSIAVDFANETEYAIAKPCVLHIRDKYLMWYSFRGKYYKPGLAISDTGSEWKRIDDRVGISVSESGWDSEMLCYPFVLQRDDDLFMFYNGNGYGASGLGIAHMSCNALCEDLCEDIYAKQT